MIKEILKFLSGVQAVHVLYHIYLQFSGSLPKSFNFFFFQIGFTPALNLIAILVNLAILGLLIYFAYRK